MTLLLELGNLTQKKWRVNTKHMRGRHSHIKIPQKEECKFFGSLEEGTILDIDPMGKKTIALLGAQFWLYLGAVHSLTMRL